MRKLLILTALTISLTQTSCKKCWTCTSTTTIDGQQSDKNETQQCDFSRKEIKTVEANNTSTTYDGNIKIQVTTTCK